jgi:hypothetical protein
VDGSVLTISAPPELPQHHLNFMETTMTRAIKYLMLMVVTLGLLMPRPARAMAMSSITICYYMGTVRDSMGNTGELWYCEVWSGNQFIGGWSQVVIE